MKQTARKAIESAINKVFKGKSLDTSQRWYWHAIHYADWLDKSEKGLTKSEVLELLGSISASTKDAEFADKLMDFVQENK